MDLSPAIIASIILMITGIFLALIVSTFTAPEHSRFRKIQYGVYIVAGLLLTNLGLTILFWDVSNRLKLADIMFMMVGMFVVGYNVRSLMKSFKK
ncbi:hypothetical protein G7061_08775 [Erysipelothrix sp. HDW6B]|uniref:hypothetical protein n=1 Tax=Erysipelothrix TaxID=1647 RepID=UPI001357FB13|nr:MULTISPECIES: hypothetical protein [Erysipelothrix]QIK86702.1 hypothetical protein G7061_08775 [Erysipelothrix sp. HDW6B]